MRGPKFPKSLNPSQIFKAMMVSFFRNPIQNNIPEVECSIEEISLVIKKDEYSIKETQERIRACSSKDERQKIKAYMLPYFTPSGLFSVRKKDGLIQHSGFICIDIDDLDSDLMDKINLKEIEKDIILYFISPSGNGYKVIMRIDHDTFSQEENYNSCIKYLSHKLDLSKSYFDKACKDVARACYVSFDPNAYFNSEYNTVPTIDKILNDSGIEEVISNNKEMTISPIQRIGKIDVSHKHDHSNFIKLCSLAVQSVGEYKKGNRHNFIVKLSSLSNKLGVDKKVLKSYCEQMFFDHPETLRKNDIFSLENELFKIIDDIYSRYSGDFNTWESSLEDIPMLDEDIYKKLPRNIERLLAFTEGKQKDVLFLSIMTVLSNWMPKVRGKYDDVMLGANLYSIIMAPPSAGKGIMNLASVLCGTIDDSLRDSYLECLAEYEKELEEWNNLETFPRPPRPQKPLQQRFIVAANVSNTALINAMKNNKNFALIIESEIDSLCNALGNKDWGNFTDNLRKCFHHEPISCLRKTNDEEIKLRKTYLSLLLSGTKNQVKRLFPSAENGFFSRFMFYVMPLDLEWKNVFDEKNICLDDFFEGQAIHFQGHLAPFFETSAITEENRILFEWTKEQKNSFNATFSKRQNELFFQYGAEILASVRRLGIIQFRLSMILCVLRLIDESDAKLNSIEKIVCKDIDFDIAESTVNTLIYHTLEVFNVVSGTKKNKFLSKKRDEWFDSLPTEFTRKNAMDLANHHGIKEKTAENYLSNFINEGKLKRPSYGHYEKK
ncbi:MAG: hypothetical protein DI598_01620 [Pseudopedobacter saltans]|uniref:BT4734-like N-terminal domain-containing protein n=1 Tax=Pseudopedobacter saltans TaxID=151895 RepID=A0A2W5H9E9_9SPHI|nr:MAG: hypothetical protein DI598_01620 [Pseudopedobacter saltans]